MTLLRVVAGVVVDGGRALAARRGPGRALAGLWEFPGGKVEAGETDDDALARELAEELGITVAVGPLVGVGLWDGGSRPLALVAYRCDLVSGAPHPHEHAEIAWLRAPELRARRWAPADVPLIPKVHEILSR
jgi:8-oxo-dGTP diphosphatase